MMQKLMLLCGFLAVGFAYGMNQDDAITITKLNPESWPQFKALRLEATAENPVAIGVTLQDEYNRDDDAYRKLLQAAMEEQDTWMLFAHKDDEYIAMAGARCHMSHLSTMKHVAQLMSVYTDPRFRRQGVSSKLIGALCQALRKHGIQKLHATVSSSGQTQAIALYESLGFTRCGGYSKDLLVDGVYYDSVLMEKHLE